MNKEEQIMMEVRQLYNKLGWLNGIRLGEALKGYKSSEVHCIEYVGKNKDVNVTKLAEAFYMTRGAMSKVTRKLIGKGIIESYQKSGNRKEIYFRLTDKGQEVFHMHERIHEEFRDRDKAIFDQVTEDQYDQLLSFVETYSRHLDAEIEKTNRDIRAE